MINSKEKYGAFVTATNREFLNIFKTLSDTRSVKGVNYAKAVIKNLQVIKEHLQPIEEMALPSEEFIELSVKAQEFLVLIDEKVLPEDISAEQIEALMKIIQ